MANVSVGPVGPETCCAARQPQRLFIQSSHAAVCAVRLNTQVLCDLRADTYAHSHAPVSSALKDNDATLFRAGLDGIRLEVLSGLAVSTLEHTKSLGPVLACLRFFREIESCWAIQSATSDRKRCDTLLKPGSL